MSLDQSEYTESTATATAATAGAQASSGAETAAEPEAAMRPEAASAGEPVGTEMRPEPEPVEEALGTGTEEPEPVEEALGTGTEEPAPGNPGLSIATIIFGVVGVILALWVSWILSVIAGIVAIVLGRMASRQNAPYPRAILAGKVLGVICIFANAFMVFTYVAYLMSLGVL